MTPAILLPLLLACALPTSEPAPAAPPKVILVVLDTLRADLGGVEVPAWWSLGRRYTHAESAATHTVVAVPVLLGGRPATEHEAAAELGGPARCGRPAWPSRNLHGWPTDTWADQVLTDQPALRALGGPSPIPYDGPGSRHITREAVKAIRAGGSSGLVVWSTGAHSPYDGMILRGGAKRSTRTMDDALDASWCGTLSPDQEGFLRLGYDSGIERVLPQAEEVVSAGLQAGAVVILTSDHGECFGEGGRWGHGGERAPCNSDVPLVVFGPGVVLGEDPTPIPATCVGQTARVALGDTTPGLCDLRTGDITGGPPVAGMMEGGTWEERVILAPVGVP